MVRVKIMKNFMKMYVDFVRDGNKHHTETDEVQRGKPTKMLFFDRWRAVRAGLRSGFWLDRRELAWK